MARFTDNAGDWFKIWREDYESIVATMRSNMISDAEAGYSTYALRAQLRGIMLYEREHDEKLEKLAHMTDAEAERWCFVDLVRRGAIA